MTFCASRINLDNIANEDASSHHTSNDENCKLDNNHDNSLFSNLFSSPRIDPNMFSVILLGKFKGLYDTRELRCYKNTCNSCTHCRYLPYVSSPLKDTSDFEGSNLNPILGCRINLTKSEELKLRFHSELDHLVCIFKEFKDWKNSEPHHLDALPEELNSAEPECHRNLETNEMSNSPDTDIKSRNSTKNSVEDIKKELPYSVIINSQVLVLSDILLI
ncbi:uncharacterized protein PRCAT00003703001 [Priceomyces carsonii]|uniref:uncharacterized protein n=1 Tax=Priceomyces carsonii TaxID=28549 RepID=UPI002ED92F9E|nr:unnamed protein product [Priceomyces carsonii]